MSQMCTAVAGKNRSRLLDSGWLKTRIAWRLHGPVREMFFIETLWG